MNREKCINRNITIASAIISGVNILTFYNAFYKCFKFKYVDDFISLIINIFTDEYKFGINFVMIYVILNLIFLFFNFARLKVIKSNFVYEIVCDVSFVIGINIFVFTQRDTARFQVLILSAYLCCLYLLNIRDLLRKI